jgi:SAM-dependent methyltransferase
MKTPRTYLHELEQCTNAMFEPFSAAINFQIAKNIDGNTYVAASCKDGAFKCLHSPVGEFLDELFIAKKHSSTAYSHKFLDVGCGVGQKVFLAKINGCEAFGIDLRQEFVVESRRLDLLYNEAAHWRLGGIEREQDKNKFTQADAITYDKYDTYGIIYFYQPISDPDKLKAMETQIAKTAKIGSVVIGFGSLTMFVNNGCGSEKMVVALGWERIGTSRCWKKIK